MGLFKLAVAAWLGCYTVVAIGDDAKIRRVLEPKLGGARIEGIQPAPVPGLFEVRFRSAEGLQIVYTDAVGDYIISGSLYEAKTDRNLTEERVRKLSAIRFDSLPLDQAVRIQRGNGRRVLAMFSDPYCPACQQFEKTLQEIDDITLYVFMFPVIRPELADHSRAVWCAPDRAKAWLDIALRRRQPVGNSTCANPVDRTLEFGRSLNVRATPTLFFANGERYSGALPADQLKAILDDSAPAKPGAVRK
jgi:thiol:disulfide interchange protein DsbC